MCCVIVPASPGAVRPRPAPLPGEARATVIKRRDESGDRRGDTRDAVSGTETRNQDFNSVSRKTQNRQKSFSFLLQISKLVISLDLING